MSRRLTLGAFYLLLVVVVGLAVPFGAALSSGLTQELGGRVEREAFAVAATAEDPLERGQPGGLQAVMMRLAVQIGGRVLVTDSKGILLADSLQPPGYVPPSYVTRPEIARALAGTPNWEVRRSNTLGYDILVSAVPIRTAGRILGAVRISYPMAAVRAAIRRAWWFLAAVGAATLCVGLALAVWLARWSTRPLKDAAAVARRIAGGELGARIPVAGPPEVQELAGDLNSMTERLSDLLRANREFAANASHQLRSPLTALRLSLEEARDGSDPRAEIGHAIEKADRLDAVVEALLELGRAREQGSQMLDLGEVAEGFISALPDGGPHVEVSGHGLVVADQERVRQILTNLVGNARRFARSRIRLSVSGGGDRVVMAVEDDGPGVPEQDRSRVFDRFYRGQRGGGHGSGLGLAVARELARTDGGEIALSHGELGGARFEVVFPAAAVHACG